MSNILILLDHLLNDTLSDSLSDTLSDSLSDTLSERSMSPYHKEKIAVAHRGKRQSFYTKRKISRSMDGKSNFAGKKHTAHAKNLIGAKRGSDDRIRGRRWIVNSSNKTYRRYQAPGGYKVGRRKFTESFIDFYYR